MRTILSPAPRLAGAVVALALLGGCNPLVLSMLGAGAGAEISQQRNSVATRTFSVPFEDVMTAMFAVMEQLEMRYDGTEQREAARVITAVVGNRNVEVEIEPLSGTLTRVSVTARTQNFQADAATAHEIIAQTARELGVATASHAPRNVAVNR